MSMRVYLNGRDCGEALVCDFDFAERWVKVVTCADTIADGAAQHKLHQADKLAREIAATAALEFVDSNSVEVECDGEKWRDLSDREFDYLTEADYEVRYLELTGRLRRHASEPSLVQLIEAE